MCIDSTLCLLETAAYVLDVSEPSIEIIQSKFITKYYHFGINFSKEIEAKSKITFIDEANLFTVILVKLI